jgi:hypothetical protein
MNKVELLFKDRSIIRNGIMLFTKSNAIDFINECRSNKILILGIDSFLLGGDWIQPSLENSIDYSNGKNIFNLYDNAISFIQGRDNSFYFEITCSE